MLRIALSIFLSGLFLGAGPCLVSCGPFLVSFIAGNKKNIKQSLWIWLIFSLSRVFAYLVLGVIAGLLSQEVIYRIYDDFLAKCIFFIGGSLVSLIGILMILNQYPQIRLCQLLKNKLVNQDTKSIAVFGLVIGLLPCAPLVTMLTYAGLISRHPGENLLYILAFGLGTATSPLLILSGLAGFIPRIISGASKTGAFGALRVFSIICGLIMIILGIQLIGKAS